MKERIDELCKTIEYLREENKRIEKNKLQYTGYDRLIAQNEKYIMRFERRIESLQDELYQIERIEYLQYEMYQIERIEHLQDELYQIERRQEVEEMR